MRRMAVASGSALAVLIGGLTLGAQAADAACRLGGAGHKIEHVVFFQFDNVHFTRDNPNVPSDLEQMPHLLNFLTSNGVLDANHHTPLISHTATDILTSITGVYGDRMGIPVANSFGYFNQDGSVGFSSSFGYWTDKIGDGQPLMIDESGKVAPAPWVPFTRAGCDVGVTATANVELENIGTDITTVFGANSPKAKEAKNNPDQATADFEGIAIHCAKDSTLCEAGKTRPDLLPDEPGGYKGFEALFGHKYVAEAIGPIKDVLGNPIPGFPGFDGMTAAVSLGYVATMLEKGVPVTYAYISDAHDNNKVGKPYGPGEAGYVAQLKAYDQAWAAFFNRLAHDGIGPQNTLFIVTSDEGDHFSGGPPSPANCDGVHVACTYAKIGEIDAYLDRILALETGDTTPFDIHWDSAPTVYIHGNPGPLDSTTFGLETAMSELTAPNPITGKTDRLAVGFADQATMRMLHMITADPARTPSFTMFGDPNYFFLTGSSCNSVPGCVSISTTDAWNHGDLQHEIVTTWLGMAGPGIQPTGISRRVWSDHTDIRATMIALAGLRDDYVHDGRLLAEFLNPSALPGAFRMNASALIALARAYKQLNAPVGQFGMAAIGATTEVIQDGNARRYDAAARKLERLTQQRDTLASAIRQVLEDATFNDQTVSNDRADRLTDQANRLLQDEQRFANRAEH